jgi:outer membrane receptor for ferrienterochelin and colicin
MIKGLFLMTRFFPVLLGLSLILMSALAGSVFAQETVDSAPLPATEQVAHQAGFGQATTATVAAPDLVNDSASEENELPYIPPVVPGRRDYTLPEVVATATRTDRDRFNLAQNITVIGQEEIVAQASANTPDLFTRQADVHIQKTNLGGGSAFIRGLTGKQVLLMIDGVRLNNSLYRYGPNQYLNTIDPLQIEKIEVLRGPSSVLYGSDALGGVINIITKRRTNFDNNYGVDAELVGRYGSAEQSWIGRTQLQFNYKQFGAIGGFTFRQFAELSAGREEGLVDNTAYREADADLKFNYRLGRRHELIAAYQLVRQYDVPKTAEINLSGKIKYTYEPQRRRLASLEYRGRRLNKSLDSITVNVNYQIQEEGERVIAEDPTVMTNELNRADTVGAFAHLNFNLPLQTLSVGGDYYRDWISSKKTELVFYDPKRSRLNTRTAITPAFPDGGMYSMLGLYLSDEYVPIEQIRLTGGLRYSATEVEGTLIDPQTGDRAEVETDNYSVDYSIGLVLGLHRYLHLVAAVATGFRAPNFEDYFGKTDFATEMPNIELEPEQSQNFEGGFKLRTEDFNLNIFYFQTYYTDLIDREWIGYSDDNNNLQQDEGESDIYQRDNLSQALISGIEIDGKVQLDRHWWLAGTLHNIEGQNLSADEPLSRIPPPTATLTLHHERTGRYFAEMVGVFAMTQARLSERDKLDPRIGERTPGYTLFNLRIGSYLGSRSHLVMGVDNIFDKSYKTHGSGIPGPGTSFVGELRLFF